MITNNPLSIALQAARERTGRNIGTAISKGLWQIQLIDSPTGKRGRCTITPVSGWIPGAEVLGVLNAITRNGLPS
jgi:hypothetical protein